MKIKNKKYPRNLLGYGNNPPTVSWPNNAKIAIQFVLNYEEGAEKNILHGDNSSETFLSDLINCKNYKNRHMSIESLYEYGSRVGFWRIHNEFKNRKIPLTIFGVVMAFIRNPEITKTIIKEKYDVVCHGLKWIEYQKIDYKKEKKDIIKSIKIFKKIFGKYPQGWYTGRDSPNTRKLIIKYSNIIYDSDYYGDDLPFWMDIYLKNGKKKKHLIIPYSLETNDMKFVVQPGFNTSKQFYQYLRDTFDILYKEGKTKPKMMSIGMHCRIIGKPGRFKALINFLDYIKNYKDIWICTRQEIANHWIKYHKIEFN
ncbi:Uricase (urate oxidase) [Candidatus Purcelliella pentastirinorum]|uniref:Uricase (Urate oxidase) n=1 Tax=Candidatus Purcelliella pentastirinorum TaxID=472834 RepID=A0A346E062_9ENTR|nr:allantoinase PuuE [Candidatus Purcelliella pentastirinorum]AXN02367.1 Uricase (urate oxidase) [Candidatus Purcelliella pentastirinorum]